MRIQLTLVERFVALLASQNHLYLHYALSSGQSVDRDMLRFGDDDGIHPLAFVSSSKNEDHVDRRRSGRNIL